MDTVTSEVKPIFIENQKKIFYAQFCLDLLKHINFKQIELKIEKVQWL